MNNDQLWQAVLGEIEVGVTKASFTTWFKKTFISSYENGTVVISVPNIFTKAWLEKKYFKELVTAFQNITKEQNIKIIYKIEAKKQEPAPSPVVENVADFSNTDNTAATQPAPTYKNVSLNKYGLNSKYRFDNFIVGKHNELAHAAALAVTANPGVAYNPLIIYGGSGLGKTHLLQAIGNELAKKTDKIIYVTSEKFSNEYISEVLGGRAKFLKEKYRNVDLLLIDDIQFLGGKEGTQQEFFHTFNELHQNNKQIIATCDRPLKTIPALEERLLTRLACGMVADITIPDTETRVAILKNKCDEKQYLLSDKIINFLAANIESNVRELEGALTKLIAYFEFNNLTPDIEITKSILFDTLNNFKQKKVSPAAIIEAASKYYNISNKDLLGQSRKKELVKPRQVTMYLLRSEIALSFPSIGQELGGRDHTTAMHACKKIEKEVDFNEKIAQEVLSIRQLLKDF